MSVRFNANLTFQHGHPILTITLPSRNQPVAFTCKPVTGTVGSLINDIIKEDGGVHQADIRTEVSCRSLIGCPIRLHKIFLGRRKTISININLAAALS